MMSLARIPRSVRHVRRLTTIAHAPSPVSEPAPAAAASPRPHHAVISIAGRDQTGIVNKVATVASEHSANIEESKMAILGGDFAMIVYLTIGSTSEVESLANRIKNELPDFSVTIRETTPPDDELIASSKRDMWKLSLEGPDQPGIVAAVSQALATHGGHVHELETETTTAPFAGYEMFKMSGRVAVGGESLDEVSQALNAIEERFGASIMLNQITEE